MLPPFVAFVATISTTAHLNTGGIVLSAEEELQTSEEAKPKATRSRVARGTRKPAKEAASADNGAVGVLTAEPASEPASDSIAEPIVAQATEPVAESPIPQPAVSEPTEALPSNDASPAVPQVQSHPNPGFAQQNGDRPRRD